MNTRISNAREREWAEALEKIGAVSVVDGETGKEVARLTGMPQQFNMVRHGSAPPEEHLPEGVWCAIETRKSLGPWMTVCPDIITEPDRYGVCAATIYLGRRAALALALRLIAAALFRVGVRLKS